MKPAARVGHKKSRTGCFKCRSRRVKCDEAAPICANCQRLGLQCQYPSRSKLNAKVTSTTSNSEASSKTPSLEQTTRSSSNSTNLSTPLSTPLSSNEATENEPGKDIPSITKSKRLELRLLHVFMSKTLPQPHQIPSTEEWRRNWLIEMPRIALEHDNLLYALLAFIAQVNGSLTGDPEVSLAQAEYFTLALQHQRAEISNPGRDVEAATLAAILIAQSAFAMLRGRTLHPYTPPVDWFEVSRGAWHVSPNMEDMPPTSTVLRFVAETTSSVWMKWSTNPVSYVDEVYAPILDHLTLEEFDHYGGDIETGVNAYKKTIAFLTDFRQALTPQGDPILHNVFRICMLAQTVPDDFVRFVRQQRPRALLITACIFAVISRTRVLRVYGDPDCSIPKSEIRAIQEVLPQEWQKFMTQPLEELALCDA